MPAKLNELFAYITKETNSFCLEFAKNLKNAFFQCFCIILHASYLPLQIGYSNISRIYCFCEFFIFFSQLALDWLVLFYKIVCNWKKRMNFFCREFARSFLVFFVHSQAQQLTELLSLTVNNRKFVNHPDLQIFYFRILKSILI